jgi:long-subunit acyl-CoA synthetase (AMP-forming)
MPISKIPLSPALSPQGRKGVEQNTAVILFTSGSESLPKAVALTHENLIENIK